jgi:hypothetical protein
VLRQGGGELGAAGVLYADEQQFRNGLGDPAVGLRGGGQLLAGEPGDQHGQEVGELG